MKISLATNFDDELIDRIKNYPVYEVYGKLNYDIIGGGRPGNYIKEQNKENFERHIKKVRDNGINFNYLLNSACVSNLNQDKEWIENLKSFLIYLKSIGVNALTISNPYIVEFVKREFSDDFIIRVSSFACIDSYEKAKYWDMLGVDIICVDFCKVNRNFKMLKYMVDHLKCKIELLCTNSCLKDCPMIHTHVNDIAHASILNSGNEKYEDWGLQFCQYYQLNNVEEYIKSPWIRPEDIAMYEKIGIEHFKITERDFTTDALVKRLDAYNNRKYVGNLLDLIQGSGFTNNEKEKFDYKESFLNRSDIITEIQRVRGIGRPREAKRHICINNSDIPPNFIDFFLEGKCTGFCNKCGYCKKIANSCIKTNDEIKDYLNFLYKKLNEMKFN